MRKRRSTLGFLRFWIDTWVSTDQEIFTSDLLTPVELLIQRVWEVSRTKPLQLWSDGCSQKGLLRVCCIESTTHTSSLFILPASACFSQMCPSCLAFVNCGLLFVEENASSKYELRFRADSWTPFFKWNRKRNIVSENEACSLAKFYYNMPHEA